MAVGAAFRRIGFRSLFSVKNDISTVNEFLKMRLLTFNILIQKKMMYQSVLSVFMAEIQSF